MNTKKNTLFDNEKRIKQLVLKYCRDKTSWRRSTPCTVLGQRLRELESLTRLSPIFMFNEPKLSLASDALSESPLASF